MFSQTSLAFSLSLSLSPSLSLWEIKYKLYYNERASEDQEVNVFPHVAGLSSRQK